MTMTDPASLDFDLCFFRLRVEDLDRMTKFYEDVFGMVVNVREKHPQFEENTLKAPTGRETILALTKLLDGEPVAIGVAHTVGILTTDVAAACENVLQCGGSIVSELTFPGGRVAVVKDPEGHSIEILHLDGGEVVLPDEL